MIEIPMMPNEFKGKFLTKTEVIKNVPRRWTKEEMQWCIDLRDKGYTVPEIAYSIGRDKVSVGIKLKRLQKNNGNYNASHLEEKRLINKQFVQHIEAKTCLDVYAAGKNDCYEGMKVITNDINKKFDTDYHLDALKFLCMMYEKRKNTFDYVDLDPYGSAYDCFDLAIKMAKKGIAITLGEMGHKRWHRLDYVRDRYGIDDIGIFTSYKMIEEIKRIGRLNHKELQVYRICDWKHISRVWFIIKPYKVTEQWNMKHEDLNMELF